MAGACKRAVHIYYLTSPLGQLELQTCTNGIHKLQISGVTDDDDFKPKASVAVDLETDSKPRDVGQNNEVIKDCIEWLTNYFHNPQRAASQPLPKICYMEGKNANATFTEKVWQTLATDISFGQTVSYGQLAERSGSTSAASRAVGQAMRNNPVSIIVPCHRVIQSGGKLGNYSGGKKNSVKVWLLEHEEAINKS